MTLCDSSSFDGFQTLISFLCTKNEWDDHIVVKDLLIDWYFAKPVGSTQLHLNPISCASVAKYVLCIIQRLLLIISSQLTSFIT